MSDPLEHWSWDDAEWQRLGFRARPLTGDAGELAELIGRMRTIYLIRRLPRRRNRPWAPHTLHIPKVVHSDHLLARFLGQERAQRVGDRFGGDRVEPPGLGSLKSSEIWAGAEELLAEGASVEKIAARLNVSPPRAKSLYWRWRRLERELGPAEKEPVGSRTGGAPP